MKSLAQFASVLLLLLCGTARADVTLDYRNLQDNILGSRIQVASGKVRIRGDSARQATLVDTRANTISVVNYAAGTYQTMTMDEARELVARLASQIRQAQAKVLHQALDGVPVNERTQVAQNAHEQLLNSPQIDGPKGNAQVGDWPCKRWTVRDKTSERDLCMSPMAELGITGEDAQALQASYSIMRMLARALPQLGAANAMPDIKGWVPVFVEESAQGHGEQLDALSLKPLDPALFEIPKGFKREAASRKH